MEVHFAAEFFFSQSVCLDVKPLLGPMTRSFFFKSEVRYCLLCPGLLFVTRGVLFSFVTQQVKLALLLTVSGPVCRGLAGARDKILGY